MMSVFRNTTDSTWPIDWSKQLTGLETFCSTDLTGSFTIIFNNTKQTKLNHLKTTAILKYFYNFHPTVTLIIYFLTDDTVKLFLNIAFLASG